MAASAASREPKDATIETFVSVFNAVFGRHVSLLDTLKEKGKARLKSCRPWQLVALPLLVAAQGLDDAMRKRLTPEILLRDGKHPRTTSYGTCGGTDWLERAYLAADQTVLNLKLSDIARAANEKCPGLIDELHRIGVRTMSHPDAD